MKKILIFSACAFFAHTAIAQPTIADTTRISVFDGKFSWITTGALLKAYIGAGSGTVSSVTVTNSNGFAGVVTNPTTTPSIAVSTTITGLLKGNGTAISAASAGTDYVIPSGSVATLTTPRAIYGNNFDGSASLTQIIASTYGGTGNGFTAFAGPATSEKTFTLPNASATILTSNSAVTIGQGGTGQTSKAAAFDALSPMTTAGDVIYGGAAGTGTRLAAGTSSQMLISGTTPSWKNIPITSKSMIVAGATASENLTFFYTDRAITVSKVADVVRGTSPSVTYNVRFATARDSGSPTDLFSSSRTVTSTAGGTTTTFGTAAIPAGSWVWLTTSATGGTLTEFHITLQFTEN